MNVRLRALGLLAGLLVLPLLATATSSAATPLHAWWHLSSRAAPTNLAPGSTGLLEVAAGNAGDTTVVGTGTPVTLTDVLPAGLTVTDPALVVPHRSQKAAHELEKFWKCTVAELRIVSCSSTAPVPPYERLELEIPVKVNVPGGTETKLDNELRVSGGEAPEAVSPLAGGTLVRPIQISDKPVVFGIEEDGYSIVPENDDGSVDTQAGSHPFQLTSSVEFNEILTEIQGPGAEEKEFAPGAPALARNLAFDVPPGLLGDITAAPQCSETAFNALRGPTNACPLSSVIGVATVTLLDPSRLHYKTLSVNIYNLEPLPGQPARFAFEVDLIPVMLEASVRTGGDYGVTIKVTNATQAAQVLGAQVTFWGDPGDPVHDNSRGNNCLREGLEVGEGEACENGPLPQTAFLTLPTECKSSLSTSGSGTAWSGEDLAASFAFQDGAGNPLAALEGCGALPFSPQLNAQPVQPAEESQAEGATTSASTPTGLSVDVKLPQTSTIEPSALAESQVRAATVRFPEGMLVNPGAANGLAACSEEQVGYQGVASTDPFAPGATQPMRFSEAPAACPFAAKIGTVQISTPLLAEKLNGAIYLATPAPNGEPGKNPFGSLIAVYLVADSAQLGLHVKLAGEGTLNEATGQITTTFADTPQVPFDDLKITLYGRGRGTVSTPAICGQYSIASSFTPWSGGAAVEAPPQPFTISSGPGGTACANPQPFSPSFAAGSTNLQAGAFTPFTLSIDNPDGDQPLQGLTMHLPAGVAALLSSVTPCPEPPAGQEWSCGPESLIGHSIAWSGLGTRPVRSARQRLPDHRLRRRPVRPTRRHPRGRRAVQPRQRRCALADPRRPEHGGCDDHERSVPAVRARASRRS